MCIYRQSAGTFAHSLLQPDEAEILRWKKKKMIQSSEGRPYIQLIRRCSLLKLWFWICDFVYRNTRQNNTAVLSTVESLCVFNLKYSQWVTA